MPRRSPWEALAATPSGPFVERDVPVSMRDGVRLRADVFRPAREGRYPTLVYRTPYDRTRNEENEVVAQALSRGYAVVLEDVRGRYGSDGVFTPYVNEGRDGFDTIEWAAAQPWSSGDVGTFGLSYPGAVQWLAAVEAPPHLKAMVPAMTFSSPRNFFYAGGAWDLSWIPWIWDNIAPNQRVRANLAGPRTGREAAKEWKRLEDVLPYRLPLTDVPELRDVAPYYFDWLAHRPKDAWWDWAELRGRYGRVGAAVLNFSGWHDEAYGPEGAITNFLGLVEARRGQADPRTQLVLGPWTHGGEDADHSGERRFGPSAPIDYAGMILRFMDRYVRGIENGADRDPRVKAFVMGENAWLSGDTMPLPGTRERPLYLAAPGTLQDGAPDAASAGAASTAFVSDPAHPVVDPYGTREGAHDYRALAKRADVAVFETPPLPEDMRVVGTGRRRDLALRGRSRRRPVGAARGRRSGRHGVESLEPRHRRAARERTRARPASAPRGRRAGPPAVSESPDRQPVREGTSRAPRALRQLHAALLAQPPDGALRGDLGKHAPRPAHDPSRRRPPLPARAARRAGCPGRPGRPELRRPATRDAVARFER